jgi:isopropylmalate/homocitrate/citramalate synthase
MGLSDTPEGSRSVNLVDCTLREGEQTAGVWFSIEEKLALVDLLAVAGLPLLDAGMPAVSEDERSFLRQATGRTSAKIGASVRARVDECQLAIDTGCDEVFVICPVSDLHMRERLGLDKAGLLRRIEAVVGTVARSGRICNVVAEDSSRANDTTLIEALNVAMNAGAGRLFLCDTVGGWTPGAAGAATRLIVENFPNVPVGIHCHDDYGMATANTVAAIEAGCDWPTATVNGVGERAGNASLAEVAAASDRLLGCPTGFDYERAIEVSRLVERLTGFVVPQHQPLVGFNAFRHESGIHVDGLLKRAETYQSVDPAMMGRTHAFVVGKHSGRALLRRFASEHGWPDDEAVVDDVLDIIKSRRPDWARKSFARVREAIDRYNDTCLGIPEARLEALFEEVSAKARRSNQ